MAVSLDEATATKRVDLLTRRNFLRLAAGSAAALALYSGEIARHELEISQVPLAIPRLPDAFSGMKIAQISDIHFEEYTESVFLEAVIRRVNALKPDLVVMTGDFVSSKPLPHRFDVGMAFHCARVLSAMECPLRYAVLGNHDVRAGAAMVTEAITHHKIPLLADASVPLERGNDRIWLAGIRDALEQEPDLSSALPAQRRIDHEPLILLAHEPDFCDRARGHEIDLILSGHTHGGQIRLPFGPPLFLPELGKKHVQGLFHLAGGGQLYVNRGIGTVGLPFRLYCPPELTVFTLSRA
jgi:uncharacterized protein